MHIPPTAPLTRAFSGSDRVVSAEWDVVRYAPARPADGERVFIRCSVGKKVEALPRPPGADTFVFQSSVIDDE